MTNKIAGIINRLNFVKLMSYKFIPTQKWFFLIFFYFQFNKIVLILLYDIFN